MSKMSDYCHALLCTIFCLFLRVKGKFFLRVIDMRVVELPVVDVYIFFNVLIHFFIVGRVGDQIFDIAFIRVDTLKDISFHPSLNGVL